MKLDDLNFPLLFTMVFVTTVARIILGKALLKKFGIGKVEFLNRGFWKRLLMDMIITLISFLIVTYLLKY